MIIRLNTLKTIMQSQKDTLPLNHQVMSQDKQAICLILSLKMQLKMIDSIMIVKSINTQKRDQNKNISM